MNQFPHFPWYFNKKGFFKIGTSIKKEMDFYPADHKDAYERNLKTQPEDWHYRTKKITYKLNSLGYRAPEFNTVKWNESVALFGCSCTFGIGVDEDETVSHYLSKELERPVINMGWPGGSNMNMLMNSLTLSQLNQRPYAIVFLWSTTDRLPLFTDRQVYNVGPWDSNENQKNVEYRDSYNDIYSSLFENYNFFIENETMNSYFISQFTKEVWKEKTKYITGTFFNNTALCMDTENTFKIDNKARDLIHPGLESNKIAASRLAHLIKNYGVKNLL